MRKLLFVLIALFICVGAVYANIGCDPKAGPCRDVESVYNNETTVTLDVGDVVEWDINSSTGDNDFYVLQPNANNTHLVAGVVVGKDIVAGARGTIATYGNVTVDCPAGIAVDNLLCSTAGSGDASAAVCSPDNAFGFATSASSGGSCEAFIFGR